MGDLSLGPAPTRKTSETDLNQWNIALRSSPAYQKFLQSIGQGQGRPTNLSGDQQKQLEHMMASAGVPIPSGMHVDAAGNLNQKSHLVRNIAIGAGLTAAALATAGAAGFGPIAGMMGGTGGAAAGGAGAASAMGGAVLPAAIAGVPAGLGTAVSLPALGLGSAAAGLGTAGAAASAAKAGTSLGGKLVKSLMSPNVLEAAGQGLGGIADAQAHNRGVTMDAQMEGDKNAIAADLNERGAQKDALHNIQVASYLKNGGAPDLPPPVLANGRTATKFDFGTRPATQEERDMGATLEKTLTDRMANPLKLHDYDSSMQPSATEKTLNWLSPVLTVASALKGGGKYQPPANAPTKWIQ